MRAQFYKLMSIRSVSRVYADVNSNLPEEYWNYDNFKIKFGYKYF